jgi:ankyrin repeat protein
MRIAVTLNVLFLGMLASLPLAAQSDAAAARNLELLAAARAGDTTAALVLLDGSSDVNLPEADGTTALHWAVLNDDLALAERLLNAGADIHASTRYGITPLYLAARNGSAALVASLLAAGADPDQQYREGETVLMTAARTGDPATVQLLLEHGANVAAREDWHGQTALMWAAAQGHAPLIPLLVAHGADIDALSNLEEWERQVTDEPREKWLPPGGMTPLQFAAREGCVACIQQLLSAGAAIDAATPKGITPLLMAIINGHYDAAWQLVEAGADVNLADDTGRTPLYAAVDFNTMPESNRPSPDVHVNSHSSMELIALLLERGADPNAQLSKQAPYRLKLDRGNDTMLRAGTTPFLRAAKGADVAALRLLLDYGADATLTTDQGIDALMAAANLGTRESDATGRYKTAQNVIEALRICMAQGLDVNTQANDGRTAIFGAAMFGLTEVVEFLHAQGAELAYQDNRGLAPLDAAMGKAGGFGFVGTDGVFQTSTVELIQRLLAEE